MPRYCNPNSHVVSIGISNPNVSLRVYPESWAARQIPENGKKYIELDVELARPLVALGMLRLDEAVAAPSVPVVTFAPPAGSLIGTEQDLTSTSASIAFSSALPANSDTPLDDEKPSGLFTPAEIAAATARALAKAENAKQVTDALAERDASLGKDTSAPEAPVKPKKRFAIPTK